MTISCKAWNSPVECPIWKYQFETKESHGKCNSIMGYKHHNECTHQVKDQSVLQFVQEWMETAWSITDQRSTRFHQSVTRKVIKPENQVPLCMHQTCLRSIHWAAVCGTCSTSQMPENRRNRVGHQQRLFVLSLIWMKVWGQSKEPFVQKSKKCDRWIQTDNEEIISYELLVDLKWISTLKLA